MRVGQRTLSGGGGQDRGLQGLRKAYDLLRGLGCSASGPYDGTLRSQQHVRRLRDLPWVGGRNDARRAGKDRGLSRRVQNVLGHLQRGWPGPARAHLRDGLVHQPRDSRHALRPRAPAGDVSERPQLVADVVEVTPTVPDVGGQHLAGDVQDGRRVGVCGAHRSYAVGRRRPGGEEADADVPARTGVSVRHEGRALLVARRYPPDRRRVLQRVEHRQGVCAREAEDGLDPLRDQRLHHRPRLRSSSA